MSTQGNIEAVKVRGFFLHLECPSDDSRGYGLL